MLVMAGDYCFLNLCMFGWVLYGKVRNESGTGGGRACFVIEKRKIKLVCMDI